MLRAVGGAQVISALLGLVVVTLASARVAAGPITNQQVVYFPSCWLVMSPLEAAWYAAWLIAGLRLLRGEQRGYSLTLLLSGIQLAYTLTVLAVPVCIREQELSIRLQMATLLALHVLHHTIPVASALLTLVFLPLLSPKARKEESSPAPPLAQDRIPHGRSGDIGGSLDAKVGAALTALPEPVWAQRVVRTLGLVSLLVVAFGFPLCVTTAVRFPQRNVWDPQQPYLAQVFWTMTVINAVFLVALAVGSVLLMRTDRRGLRLCNLVFAAEILYWLASGVAPLYLGLAFKRSDWAIGMARSVGGATGIGNMGISLQILTAYPIIALVALNLAFRRIPSLTGPPAHMAR